MRHGAVVREGRSGNVISIALGRVRQAHVLEGVHRKICFRRDERRVRTEETDAKKERLVALLGHQLDRLGGDHAIGLLLVRTLGC